MGVGSVKSPVSSPKTSVSTPKTSGGSLDKPQQTEQKTSNAQQNQAKQWGSAGNAQGWGPKTGTKVTNPTPQNTPATKSLHARALSPDVDPKDTQPLLDAVPPPKGFVVERSTDQKSIAYFLENYPVLKGNDSPLRYDDKTRAYLHKKMPTKEAMDKAMEEIGSWKSKGMMLKGERVSKGLFDNKFSNPELLAMYKGWEKGVDIRDVNYFKTVSTDSKLNLRMLNEQDCIDSALRLWIEHRLVNKDYGELNRMGVNVKPGMSDQAIDAELTKFFRTTHTGSFAAQHHEIGHRMTDEQLEKSKLDVKVGDIITFNEKDKLGSHSAIVVAKAVNPKTGEQMYRIATGTLPATEMALYKDWYSAGEFLGGSLSGTLDMFPGGNLFRPLFERGLKSDDHTVSIGRLRGN